MILVTINNLGRELDEFMNYFKKYNVNKVDDSKFLFEEKDKDMVERDLKDFNFDYTIYPVFEGQLKDITPEDLVRDL